MSVRSAQRRAQRGVLVARRSATERDIPAQRFSTRDIIDILLICISISFGLRCRVFVLLHICFSFEKSVLCVNCSDSPEEGEPANNSNAIYSQFEDATRSVAPVCAGVVGGGAEAPPAASPALAAAGRAPAALRHAQAPRT